MKANIHAGEYHCLLVAHVTFMFIPHRSAQERHWPQYHMAFVQQDKDNKAFASCALTVYLEYKDSSNKQTQKSQQESTPTTADN